MDSPNLGNFSWSYFLMICSDKLKLDTEGVETGHGKQYSEKDTGILDRSVQEEDTKE